MQTLKVDITGNFYDSLIYSGQLFLWGMDGSITCANWKYFETNFLQNGKETFDEFLYENDNFVKKIKNPFPFPHSDCFIYNHNMIEPKLYFSNSDGLFETPYYEKGDIQFGTYENTTKLTDMQCFDLNVKEGKIVMACGDDGVFCYDKNYGKFNKILGEHSTWTNWVEYGVISSSYYNSGYLIKTNNINSKKEIEFAAETYDMTEILGAPGLSWGCKDKVAMLNENGLNLFYPKYSWNKKGMNRFENIKTIKNDEFDLDGIIRASSIRWGHILEYKTKLLIVNDKLEIKKIEYENQEITNWRIFPRAKKYHNQLHVIFDNHMSIYLLSNYR